jgi:muconolactone delta-isomerase
MKVVAIAHRSDKHKPEDFAPHLEAESNHALKLLAQEKIREIYSRVDGKGAVVVMEVADEDEARRLLAELPMAKRGMIRFDLYPTKPYRGIVQHVK